MARGPPRHVRGVVDGLPRRSPVRKPRSSRRGWKRADRFRGDVGDQCDRFEPHRSPRPAAPAPSSHPPASESYNREHRFPHSRTAGNCYRPGEAHEEVGSSTRTVDRARSVRGRLFDRVTSRVDQRSRTGPGLVVRVQNSTARQDRQPAVRARRWTRGSRPRLSLVCWSGHAGSSTLISSTRPNTVPFSFAGSL